MLGRLACPSLCELPRFDEKELDKKEYKNKLEGFWLGQSIANWTGIITEMDKIVDKNGIKILGDRNILNKLPYSSSVLYSKNVFNFISNLFNKEKNEININLEDEIIAKTIIK